MKNSLLLSIACFFSFSVAQPTVGDNSSSAESNEVQRNITAEYGERVDAVISNLREASDLTNGPDDAGQRAFFNRSINMANDLKNTSRDDLPNLLVKFGIDVKEEEARFEKENGLDLNETLHGLREALSLNQSTLIRLQSDVRIWENELSANESSLACLELHIHTMTIIGQIKWATGYGYYITANRSIKIPQNCPPFEDNSIQQLNDILIRNSNEAFVYLDRSFGDELIKKNWTNEINQVNSLITETKDRISNLNSSINSGKDTVTSTEKDIEKLKKSILLKEIMAKVDGQIGDLFRFLFGIMDEKRKEQLRNATEQIGSLSNRVNSNLSDLNAAFAAAEKKVTANSADIVRLSNDSVTNSEHIACLYGKCDGFIGNLSGLNQQLGSDRNESAKRSAALNESVIELKIDVQQLTETVVELNETVVQNGELSKNNSASLNDLKTRVSNVENSIASNSQNIADQSGRVNVIDLRLSQTNMNVSNLVAAHADFVNKTDSQIKNISDEMKILNGTIHDLLADLTRVEEEHNRKAESQQKNITELTKRLACMETRLKELGGQIESLNRTNQVQAGQITNLGVQIENLNQTSQKQAQQLNEKVERLKDQVDIFSSTNHDQAQQLKDAHKKVSEKTEELRKLMEKVQKIVSDHNEAPSVKFAESSGSLSAAAIAIFLSILLY